MSSTSIAPSSVIGVVAKLGPSPATDISSDGVSAGCCILVGGGGGGGGGTLKLTSRTVVVSGLSNSLFDTSNINSKSAPAARIARTMVRLFSNHLLSKH